ncbi:luciferase-like monooxygenase family protein [Mycobacterium xenopi 4042]|uniref:Luciferase-like monooxygenase family protein n=1 Tax=Mycobacterium xenopi 4042 TaxID=1299334 RepID=X8AG18_MYCXE|nr:luciferase-like monooxygenase family protein [Mycobacterium xenopi 4042]
MPNDFDALTAVALMATRTSRIELGTAVVPLQAQHPIALARQALSVHAAAGAGWRLVSDLRITGSSATCSACPTSGLPRSPATTWRCLSPRSAARTGRRRKRHLHRA